MELRYQTDCQNIDWTLVPAILEEVSMGFATPAIHKQSFEASYSVIFVFDGEHLVGFGRILSDGVRQSAVYDVAILPSYQGKRIGQEIISRLIKTTPNCNFILYASPGKEPFYKKLGFKKMKTGMALFTNNELMQKKGFLEE